MHSIQSKTILNKTKRRDPWSLDDYTINPYSGCSFNCLFCYIRGSKYGEHMERSLAVKENAIGLLDKQLSLRAKKNQYGIIVLSSATEPYLQFEEEQKMTRRILECILHHRFPVHIITRSNLVARDFDLLREIDQQAILPPDLEGKLPAKAIISFSFSTLVDETGRIFEPGATPPSQRLDCLVKTLDAGFFSGVSLMPLLPFISDNTDQLDLFYSTFAKARVKYIFPASITLFGDSLSSGKTLTLRAVEKHFPGLIDQYRKLFSNGYQADKNYQEAFNSRVSDVKNKYNIPDRILF